MKGTTVQSKIKQTLEQAKRDEDTARKQFDDADKQHQACVNRLRNAINIVVQSRMDNTGTLSALADADRKVASLAQRRAAKQTALQLLTNESEENLSRIEDELAQARNLRDERAAAWNERKGQTLNEVRQINPEFAEREQRVKGYQDQIVKIDGLITEREERCKELENKINQDLVFAYCSKQKAGTPQAHGNALVRWLDSHIARVSGYNTQNEVLVLAQEQVERLRSQQDRLRQNQNMDKEWLDEAVATYNKREEIIAIRTAFEDSKIQLAQTGTKRDMAAQALNAAREQLRVYQDRRDSETHDQQECLFNALMGARANLLIQAAQETETQEDDRAVEIILQERKSLPAYKEAVEHAEKNLTKATAATSRVRTISDNFKSRSYARSDSHFRPGVDVDSLLVGVMLGSMTTDSAWSSISQGHYRVEETPRYSPSSSSNDWGGSSGSSFGGSSGGFSSSSSFGGDSGGFSTTDSF